MINLFTMNTLSDRIYAAMELRGMSQADLARATGMHTSIVSQICSGTTKNPTFANVVKIARALDVSLDFLAGRR